MPENIREILNGLQSDTYVGALIALILTITRGIYEKSHWKKICGEALFSVSLVYSVSYAFNGNEFVSVLVLGCALGAFGPAFLKSLISKYLK